MHSYWPLSFTKWYSRAIRKYFTLNSAFSCHVLAFALWGLLFCFPKVWAVLNSQLWRETKAEAFFFILEKMLQGEKVISIHFITYLWAEIVSLLNSTQNYNKSFVIHWETRFSFILIASGNTEQILKQVFLFHSFFFF